MAEYRSASGSGAEDLFIDLFADTFGAEKANSIFARGGYIAREAERNILANPFKRFEDMNMMRHTKTLGIVQVDASVWKKLSGEEKQHILQVCDEKLEQYYARLRKA